MPERHISIHYCRQSTIISRQAPCAVSACQSCLFFSSSMHRAGTGDGMMSFASKSANAWLGWWDVQRAPSYCTHAPEDRALFWTNSIAGNPGSSSCPQVPSWTCKSCWNNGGWLGRHPKVGGYLAGRKRLLQKKARDIFFFDNVRNLEYSRKSCTWSSCLFCKSIQEKHMPALDTLIRQS